MRIMIDTNVLVSAFVFKGETITKMVDTLVDYHTIVLSSYVLNDTLVQNKYLNFI